MSYDDVCKSALALSPAERLNLLLMLGESLRKPLDAPKPKRKSAKVEAEAEGAAAAGGGGGEAAEPKKPNAWQTGLTAVRGHLKTLEAKGSLAMKLGAELKKLESWPTPTDEEIAVAVEAVPEEDRVSKASGGSKASGSKRSKSAKLVLPEGLAITVKELTAAQKELYEALSEEDREKYDAEVAKRRARAEKAKATRAAKKTGKVEEAAAGGGGGAVKAEESEDESEEESEDEFEEEAEMKEWVGDIGKGERKYERVNFKGTSYLWETVKGERQYLGALKTKKDGSYTVDKKVAEPELE